MTAPPVELYGLRELAGRLGVTYQAVRHRRVRGQLPPPDAVVSGAPVWWAGTIDRWIDEAAADEG